MCSRNITGTGCQSAFGSCTGGTTPPPTTTNQPPSSGTRPRLGNVPYGVTLSDCSVPGTVALTFDDGPYMYVPNLDKLRYLNSRIPVIYMPELEPITSFPSTDTHRGCSTFSMAGVLRLHSFSSTLNSYETVYEWYTPRALF